MSMTLAQDSVSICTTSKSFSKDRIKEEVLKEVLEDFDTTNVIDQMDLVSIIFLMTDEKTNSDSVLNLLEKEPATLFLNLKESDNWAEKFIEALMIIGNFKIIGKLGYTESEIQFMKDYFVYNVHNVSVNLNKVIKSLYFLCKNLRLEEMKKLTAKVNGELLISMDSPWLELHILHWLKKAFITIDPGKPDLSKLIKVLKQIGILTNFSQSFNFESWELNNKKQHISSTYSTVPKNGESLQFSHSNSSDRAELSDNTPFWSDDHEKLCIIINEVEFMNKKKYKDRLGSDKDAENLKRTFKGCGFEVELYRNHKTEDMNLLLDSLSDSELHYHNYRSIVVCILSHGFEGEVVLSDDESIEIKAIEKKLCCQNLLNTFKLIILQTCQGEKIGVVDKKLVVDGPTMPTGNPIHHQNFGVFQATINEFASLRHEENGSWFIEEICNILREKTPIALNEWIASVTDRVMKRRGQIYNGSCKNEDVVQVPCYRGTWTTSTLSYRFCKYRLRDDS